VDLLGVQGEGQGFLAVGEKGDGIAKKNGFVLFVPGTKKGDNVKIRVTKVLRRVGFAEVIGKSNETAPPKESPQEGEETEETEESETSEDTEDFGEDSGESQE